MMPYVFIWRIIMPPGAGRLGGKQDEQNGDSLKKGIQRAKADV